MSPRSDRYNLKQLRDQAVQDALEISDAEMAQEDAEDGVDGVKAAEDLRASMREVAARFQRNAAPMRSPNYVPVSERTRAKPAIDRLKAVVQSVFAREPELGLAFRDGKKQTDGDWESLYDDLVDMGAINPDRDAD
jgi:hypothetical protein